MESRTNKTKNYNALHPENLVLTLAGIFMNSYISKLKFSIAKRNLSKR